MSEFQAISQRPAIAVKRAAASVWILRPQGALDRDLVADLCSRIDDTLEQGARDVVVELGSAGSISVEAVEVLEGLTAALLARDSVLWLAAPWPDGRGHTLRPVRETGIEAMRGVSDELDRALETCDDARSRRPAPR